MSIKKKLESKKFLSQLVDFVEDILVDNAVRSEKQNTPVENSQVDAGFTSDNISETTFISENDPNIRTLVRSQVNRITRETHNLVDTVADRTQNAIFASLNSFSVAGKKWAIKLLTASSAQDVVTLGTSS